MSRSPKRPPYENPDGTWSIPLTKGQVAIVDAEDKDLGQFNWYASRSGVQRRSYAVRTLNDSKDRNRHEFLHKRIAERLGLRADSQVDHEDGNPFNCVRSNLRQATTSDNGCNRGKSPRNASGYKGVSFDVGVGRWRAQIWKNRKRLCLGFFHNIIEAALAYDEAARRLHGPFACTNYPAFAAGDAEACGRAT